MHKAQKEECQTHALFLSLTNSHKAGRAKGISFQLVQPRRARLGLKCSLSSILLRGKGKNPAIAVNFQLASLIYPLKLHDGY